MHSDDPDRCPVCHRSLEHFNEEGARKHIKRCKERHLNALKPHDGRGRPRTHHHIADAFDSMRADDDFP